MIRVVCTIEMNFMIGIHIYILFETKLKANNTSYTKRKKNRNTKEE